MIPLQMGVLFNSSALWWMLGLFAIGIVLLIGVALWVSDGEWKDYVPGRMQIYEWMGQKYLLAKLGGGDALLIIPFSDGLLTIKRGYFDKSLVGNISGYETKDGDYYLVSGSGEYQFYLLQVPIVLCMDPSKMAGAIHPVKALMGELYRIGAFVRVDRQGNPISRGPALEGVPEAFEDIEVEESADGDADTDGTTAADGGELPVAAESPYNINDTVHDELYDFSPPARVSEDGEIERGDGWLVSANAAADLVPKPVTRKDLEILKQRERNAAMDNSKLIKFIGIGALIGSGATLAGVGVYAAASGLL